MTLPLVLQWYNRRLLLRSVNRQNSADFFLNSFFRLSKRPSSHWKLVCDPSVENPCYTDVITGVQISHLETWGQSWSVSQREGKEWWVSSSKSAARPPSDGMIPQYVDTVQVDPGGERTLIRHSSSRTTLCGSRRLSHFNLNDGWLCHTVVWRAVHECMDES